MKQLAHVKPACRIQLIDPQDCARRNYGAIAGSAYLVRPDGHVAARFRDASASAIATALKRALGEGATP